MKAKQPRTGERFLALPDWPELGIYAPWLAIIDEEGGEPLPLTSREGELLAVLADEPDVGRAAKRLGITVATLRTHTKSICRKLNVSGLTAALTLWFLSRGSPLSTR